MLAWKTHFSYIVGFPLYGAYPIAIVYMPGLYRVKLVQIALMVLLVEAPSCANSVRDIERCPSYIIGTQIAEITEMCMKQKLTWYLFVGET